jgi:hypothetical protein
MTNREAIGYMLLACKEVGLDKDSAKKLYSAMYWQFDFKTESEANELGHEWYHSLEE